MKKPKPEPTVKVAELKARLSEYLRTVRQGQPVTVCDRETPIARLVPLDSGPGPLVVRERRGTYGGLQAVPLPPVSLTSADAVRFLMEDRESGR